MNDDIFPLVEKEFEGQVIGAELYAGCKSDAPFGAPLRGVLFTC